MHEAGLEVLESSCRVLYDPELVNSRRELLLVAAEADALIVRNRTRVDLELAAASPRLRVVGRLGSGLDNLDLKALAGHDVKVVYAPGLNAQAVAEWCLAAALTLRRRIMMAHQHVFRGGWDRQLFTGPELAEATVGVLGFGRIASRLVRLLEPFGVDVLTHHPRRSSDDPEFAELGVANVGLNRLIESSTILIVLLPLQQETERMLGEAELRLLPEGAVLAVAGRGGVVDERAALTLLREGKLGGLALDVYAEEPPAGERFEPYSELNLLLTPHSAGWSPTSQAATSLTVTHDVLRVLDNREPEYPAAAD
jgi:phosphoglycerate dehydrogenase-like enzyme